MAAVCLLVAGCANRGKKPDLPAIETVCLELKGFAANEEGYLRRRTAEALAQEGFKLQAQLCEATLIYTVFGAFQAETRRGFFARPAGYWSLEGTVTLMRDGATAVELDVKVNLRDYSEKTALLDALASDLVSPIERHYRPRMPPQ
jgi:hypothetical protein